MNKVIKNIPLLILIIYFFIGSYYSIKTGITHDEPHEQEVWEYNINAATGIIRNNDNYNKLENYRFKYYGIGSQIISQPIQYILKDLIKKFQKIDDQGAKLLSKHFVIFLFFFISAIFVYKILRKINISKNFSYLATLLYMLYPYLLGHGFYNPKDTPFASIWLICTYTSFLLAEKIYEKKDLKNYTILLFAAITAFLISIRIAGILIFIQYFITFILIAEIKGDKILFFIKKLSKEIILFSLFVILLIYISYPIFWKNPFEIVNAIIFMGNFPDATGCTMLLGRCVPAQNLEPSYIPLWLIIKLPTIILIGLLLIPFSEKKIFIYEKNKIFFGTVLITVFVIPILLIFNKTVLYDEIRQILFLVPLFYILGIASIYFFSKKISYLLVFLFIIFFTYENIKIYPYQYAWVNIPSRFIKINNNFDPDYWSVSGRALAIYLSQKEEFHNKNICIFGFPYHAFKPFLDHKKFSCFKPDSQLQLKNRRPFIGIQIGKNLRRTPPNGCHLAKEERFNLLFHREKIVVGRLIYCD